MTTHTTPRLRQRRWRAALTVACLAIAGLLTAAGQASAIEIVSFDASLSNYQAAGHPNSTVDFNLATEPLPGPMGQPGSFCGANPCMTVKGGPPKDIVVDLPEGIYAAPQNAQTCMMDELFSKAGTVDGTCPVSSQVGLVNFEWIALGKPVTNVRTPLYLLQAERGEVAKLGFRMSGIYAAMSVRLRSDGVYALRVSARNIYTASAIYRVRVHTWGVPNDPANNPERRIFSSSTYGAPPTGIPLPFMVAPSECGVDGDTGIRMRSWQHPDNWFAATAPPWQVHGCEQLRFEPRVEVETSETAPDGPTGITFKLDLPQDFRSPHGVESPPLRDATVRLPAGMSINPAAADGLEACTDEQLGLGSGSEVSCPFGSKIGTVVARTPVLDEEVEGSVFVRSQNSGDPESGEMFRLALVLENEKRGILVKLPGSVRADAETGRLEATFLDNPQLPVSEIEVSLKGGPRAPLALPAECGEHRVESELSAWSGHRVTRYDSFEVECGPRPFEPSFGAGTVSATSGAFSPFNLVVAREDGTKELKAIKSVRLPEGLLGRVASVPLCGEAQAAAGTCGEASRVGHVQAALGSGSSPLWVPQAGKEPTAVYLAGPYRGAPYSLAIVVPAQAGPFDLGKVVVRSALHVDERTTAITTGIDETRLIDTDGTVTEVLPEALPTILKGIVLRQREIRVIMDREDFMVNPTDCSQKEITAEIYSVDDDRVDVGNPFRAVDCAVLGFAPKFRAKILDKGRKSTLRSFHPRTRFAVVPRKGDANIGGARVVLPSSTLLDQANIGTTCTRAQMAERNCPEASIVGYAKAWSPLLREVVEGPVYLAANGGARPLPDLAAVLDGEIRVVLQGEVSTLRSGGKARLQNTFRVVPDAPVSRFVLTMRGGAKRGLLVNSTDLCRSKEKGLATFIGQNNRRSRTALKLTPSFKGCGKVRRQAARRAAAHRALR